MGACEAMFMVHTPFVPHLFYPYGVGISSRASNLTLFLSLLASL